MNRFLRVLCLLIPVLVVSLSAPAQTSAPALSRGEYLSYATAAAEQGWGRLEAERDAWRKSIDLKYVFGYNPPGNEPYLAALLANLYELTGERSHLDRARKLLVEFGRFRDAYPKDFFKSRGEYSAGLPALPNIFYFPKYCRAYEVTRDAGVLNAADRKVIEENIAGSADMVANFQEWGAMNRAILRAEALLYAAKLLPSHPHQPRWKTIGEGIASDNWDEWEIEDATGYHGVWVYSLLGYASDVRRDESLYRSPLMHYYFEYFLALMSPAGHLPDFGDANWMGGWDRFVPFFEKGAAVYNDPRYRWAAAELVRRRVDLGAERKNVFLGLIFTDALRWGNTSIPATRPTSLSQQVLDDMVGKKIVFRNGWDSTSTYLLYNYRDEGDGGWLYRENLRNSIPVEEEKMHHGHADENSIVLLMKNGSMLLHDAGYRDFMPSGPFGAFRADYYHNRLVVRDNKIALGQKQGEQRFANPNLAAVPGQSVLEFLRNSGAYRDIRTRRIDFQRLRDVDMTRTRIIDDHLGYEADRMVAYVKELEWFVVFDVVRFTRPGYLTMANLWHTRQVHATGPGWYDTGYDSVQTFAQSDRERLLVVLPRRAQLTDGVEDQRRHYQQEKTIYQMIGRHGYRNDLQVFVTVLIPHGRDIDPATLASRVRMLDVSSPSEAVGVVLTQGTTSYTVAAKMDLEAELTVDWKRPMYSYESGRTTYGDFETDAYTLYAVDDGSTIRYSISGGVKVSYRGTLLHEQTPVSSSLHFDGSPGGMGTTKMRTFEGTFRKKP